MKMKRGPQLKHHLLKKFVTGRWVFKIKTHEHDVAVKYKDTFAAKKFAQTEGVDFGETFAATNPPETLRLVLAITAQHTLH